MRIEIRVDRDDFRRWHLLLADDLRRKIPAAEVKYRFEPAVPPLLPAVSALLALERLVLRGPPRPLWDLCPPPLDEEPADFLAEAIVDCTGRGGADHLPTRIPVLRPLFDGSPASDAMIGALLARRMPEVEIESAVSGAVLARGTVSSEAAAGLSGGIESVLSRVILLIVRVLVSPDGFSAKTGLPRPPASTAARAVVAFGTRSLAMNCARAIYHLCVLAPHWRIGWRLHDGPGVFERHDLGGPRWTILADPGRRFFADPFPVTWQGQTSLFFEDLDHGVGKGTIGAIKFGDHGPEGEVMPILEEPWHLSYPFIIEDGGVLWMIPESSLSGAIPLYRCVEFPHRWERAGTLVEGIEAADTTVFRHGGRFWMTTATREGRGGYSDTLRIFHAPALLGPWEEHGLKPVLLDVAAARPAGAIIERNGELWRPVQDCTKGYGKALALARIDRLDADAFAQTVVTRIESGPLWPGGRLHTLNRTGRLECIDGTTYNPRLAAARPFANRKMQPGILQQDGTIAVSI